jgi:hypothetical protein
MPMKRLHVTLALTLVSLAVAGAAFGGATTYAGPKQWAPGEGYGSSYSASWLVNHFSTYGSGYDKTVTFIDNRSYRWHNTVRNTKSETETYSVAGMTDKGHCLAHTWGFWGSCWLH